MIIRLKSIYWLGRTKVNIQDGEESHLYQAIINISTLFYYLKLARAALTKLKYNCSNTSFKPV